MSNPQHTNNLGEISDISGALRAGRTGAFEIFVRHFRSRIFHYTWLMCGSREDAEEVAQDTLLKVFQNFDQLRRPEHLRAWVFRIARNTCLMHRRRSVFAPEHELSVEDLPPDSGLPAPDDTPDTELLRTELRAVVERIVADLPPAFRAVVVLRDLEELSPVETAEVLDLTTDVVKTRLYRARRIMREKLDCYVNNHCLEGQARPDPSPLSPHDREALYSAWRTACPEPCDSGHRLDK